MRCGLKKNKINEGRVAYAMILFFLIFVYFKKKCFVDICFIIFNGFLNIYLRGTVNFDSIIAEGHGLDGTGVILSSWLLDMHVNGYKTK